MWLNISLISFKQSKKKNQKKKKKKPAYKAFRSVKEM